MALKFVFVLFHFVKMLSLLLEHPGQFLTLKVIRLAWDFELIARLLWGLKSLTLDTHNLLWFNLVDYTKDAQGSLVDSNGTLRVWIWIFPIRVRVHIRTFSFGIFSFYATRFCRGSKIIVWFVLIFRLGTFKFHLLANQLLLCFFKHVLLMEDSVGELVFKIFVGQELFDSWRQKLVF